jgi:nicotinamide mononucleotide transporter
VTLESIVSQLAASGPLEVVAVVLALAYLLLAARLSLWCWPAAFVSTAIYLWLFLSKGLYQQSLLQVFYLVMAVYGYVHWRGGGRQDGGRIVTWGLHQHASAIAIVLVATAITGFLEARYTQAPLPWLDAFTTWGSVVTTWMVARKVIENWLYWLVVDSALVYVALQSGYVATAGLFLVYLGIVIAGYVSWRRQLARAVTTGVPEMST